MIIEGKHAELGQGIFISDIQEGSAAEQVIIPLIATSILSSPWFAISFLCVTRSCQIFASIFLSLT